MLSNEPPKTPPPPLVQLRQVEKRFASGLHALQGMALELQCGEFVTLLGPSGCGKSTVLRLVAGLEAPSAGTVLSPAQHGQAETAFVFQEPTLMPWAPVLDNVALPLRLQGQPRAKREAAARETLARVGLQAFEQAYPHELSGGMKMRASIARALVTSPQLLLMDEPFAALDDITRQRLNADLQAWWGLRGMAVLFVTHNVAEAVFLSQRVLVMSERPGRVIDELRIEAPFPRAAGWRHSAEFGALCQHLAAALERAGTVASA